MTSQRNAKTLPTNRHADAFHSLAEDCLPGTPLCRTRNLTADGLTGVDAHAVRTGACQGRPGIPSKPADTSQPKPRICSVSVLDVAALITQTRNGDSHSSDWAVGLATVRTRTLAGSGWWSGGGEAQVAARREYARSVISMERLACEGACVSSGCPCGPDWKVQWR